MKKTKKLHLQLDKVTIKHLTERPLGDVRGGMPSESEGPRCSIKTPTQNISCSCQGGCF